MKRFFKHSIRALFFIFCIPHTIGCLPPDSDIFVHRSSSSTPITEWLVIGAGPAGLCVVGVLIDVGIDPKKITWLDPDFNVGRIGNYYANVPANSNIQEFIKFVNSCACFQECAHEALAELNLHTDVHAHPNLEVIIKPLRCITHHLCTKVKTVRSSMKTLNFEHSYWDIGTSAGEIIHAQHVVLATGSHPKVLDYKTQQIIPLDVALDPQNLHEIITPYDTVAVIGDAHSAVLLLKFLSEMPVRHIYNFYQNPFIYAANLDGWIINGTTGLKGLAAEWARNVLEKNPPLNLTRLKSSPALLESMLPQCTKTIYAIGYERNQLPAINDTTAVTNYNATNGVIAPRLFGIGIAFPEKRINQFGHEETRIGLDSFMDYAHRLVPHWIHDDFFKYGRRYRIHEQMKKLAKVSDLFSIWTL